ncbi:hypothetical protein Taro_029359, partial [Colocasia esculenta]|nr:hypothetical protein [Colocasia esculenta]
GRKEESARGRWRRGVDMGRSPCCDEEGLKKGPWTPEEDKKLVDYIQKNGHSSWRALPRHAGLNRCGKSCRLRWTNYLRPDIKRGKFTDDEERLIINFHAVLGNKWSAIATRLPGRTDNEIKNYWNTHLRKKLLQMGIDPVTHRPRPDLRLLANLPSLLQAAASLGNLPAAAAASNPWDVNALGRLQADAAQLARMQLLQGLVQAITAANSPPSVDMASLLGAAAMLGGYQPAGELLQQQGRPFQGLLDGSSSASGLGQVAPAPGSPGLHGSVSLQMPINGAQQLLAQCSLPGGERGLQLPEGEISSPKVSVSENTNSFSVNLQMPGSGNNTAASLSMMASMGAPLPSENISLDQFWEMIKHGKDGVVSPADSSTLSFETWGTLNDAENDLPCWQDIDQPSTFTELGNHMVDGNLLGTQFGR